MFAQAPHRRSSAWRSFAFLRAALIAALVVAALLGSGGLVRGAPRAAVTAPKIDVSPVTASAPAGGTLMYKIRVDNDRSGSKDLWRVDVTLFYDPGTLTLVDSKLRSRHDWVSEVGHGNATVQFGSIKHGDDRSATLVFHVNPAVASGAPIQAKAAYHWWAADTDRTGTCRIDDVIAVSTHVAPPAFIVPRAGPPGTVFQIGASDFLPEERVVTWLNTPGGVQPLTLAGTTNAAGSIRLQFESAGLAPGSYGLVMHGIDSEREVVLPFLLTPLLGERLAS